MAKELNLNKFFVEIGGFLKNGMRASKFLFKGFEDCDEIYRFLSDRSICNFITGNSYRSIGYVNIYDRESIKFYDHTGSTKVNSVVVKDSITGKIYMLPDRYSGIDIFKNEDLLIVRVKPSNVIENDDSNMDRIISLIGNIYHVNIDHSESWILDYHGVQGNMLETVIERILGVTGKHHFAIDMHLLNMDEISTIMETFSPTSEKIKGFDSVRYFISGKANTNSELIYEFPYMESNETIVLNRIYPEPEEISQIITPISRV